MQFVTRALKVLPLAAACVSARASQASLDLCQELHTLIPSRLAYDPSGPQASSNNATLLPHYDEAKNRYWNGANQDDTPACVLFPSSAEDVSAAMTLLSASPTVPFAMKSGGHDWNRGWSSVDGGLLISFRPFLNYTTLAADGSSAEVGPGARWGEVLGTLDASNKAVVGGRLEDIGAGGLVIKGGLSFLTPQYGFASDNVLSFEVVLADGEIVNANATSHPDLFFALRGGGNSFGAVTKLTLLTHDIGNVWGGMRMYTNDKAPQLLSAITNFIARYNDTKANITPTILWNSAFNGTDVWQVQFFYDGEAPPSQGNPFADFDAIPDASSDSSFPIPASALAKLAPHTQRYKDVLATSRLFVEALTSSSSAIPPSSSPSTPPPPPTKKCDAMNSLPNLPHASMLSFLTTHYSQAKSMPFLQSSGFSGFNIALQPIPTLLQNASFTRGPAALSPDPASGDKLWIEYGLQWDAARLDYSMPLDLMLLVDAGRSLMQGGFKGVEPTRWGGAGDLEVDPYVPLFANDAHAGQGVLGSYGKGTYGRGTYERLRGVSARYDPGEMFVRRTRGYKF